MGLVTDLARLAMMTKGDSLMKGASFIKKAAVLGAEAAGDDLLTKIDKRVEEYNIKKAERQKQKEKIKALKQEIKEKKQELKQEKNKLTEIKKKQKEKSNKDAK